MTTKRSKNAEYSAAWRARNPEKALATAAAYRARNPEKVRAATAAWRARNLEAARAADVEHSRRYVAKNKDRVLANKADYYQKNKDHILAQKAEYRKHTKKAAYFRNIKSRFGLSEEQFLSLLDAQNGRCAICDDPFVFGEGRRKTANVDHCHDTGVIRGLLCGGCNTGLGNLRDAPELLRRAVAYLERHK